MTQPASYAAAGHPRQLGWLGYALHDLCAQRLVIGQRVDGNAAGG
jgi:hypothetical protein